jgi:hypothetical protein
MLGLFLTCEDVICLVHVRQCPAVNIAASGTNMPEVLSSSYVSGISLIIPFLVSRTG